MFTIHFTPIKLKKKQLDIKKAFSSLVKLIDVKGKVNEIFITFIRAFDEIKEFFHKICMIYFKFIIEEMKLIFSAS